MVCYGHGLAVVVGAAITTGVDYFELDAIHHIDHFFDVVGVIEI